MAEIYGSAALNDAILNSRRLMPTAIDCLSELIAEATGRSPDHERVEHVGRFWLMQACDRVVAEVDGVSGSAVNAIAESSLGMISVRSRLLERLGKQGASVCIVEPYLKLPPQLELIAALRARRLMRWQSTPHFKPVATAANFGARQLMARHSASTDGLVHRLRMCIARSAPTDLVEEHHALSDWADQHPMTGQKLLYTANAHQSSTSFRHVSFAQRRRGGKFLIHQHGGGYGVDQQHLGEDCDIAMSDVFYTWGWERPELGTRVRALPSPLPPRSRGAGVAGYLLMSLPVTSHVYRLQPFIIPAHIERCVKETVTFLNELTDTAPIKVRSSGVHVFPMERLQSCSASIGVDDLSEPGTTAAVRAALVIHNYLGTSWLETLAMNVPTVCFYDPAMYSPREAARPYIDVLARVGVIHHSGAQAARFVNQLKGNPSVWWNSAEVQEAREAFVARYANFSDNWLQAWTEEFERLLDE